MNANAFTNPTSVHRGTTHRCRAVSCSTGQCQSTRWTPREPLQPRWTHEISRDGCESVRGQLVPRWVGRVRHECSIFSLVTHPSVIKRKKRIWKCFCCTYTLLKTVERDIPLLCCVFIQGVTHWKLACG